MINFTGYRLVTVRSGKLLHCIKELGGNLSALECYLNAVLLGHRLISPRQTKFANLSIFRMDLGARG